LERTPDSPISRQSVLVVAVMRTRWTFIVAICLRINEVVSDPALATTGVVTYLGV
jgi:hypothetical protein